MRSLWELLWRLKLRLDVRRLNRRVDAARRRLIESERKGLL